MYAFTFITSFFLFSISFILLSSYFPSLSFPLTLSFFLLFPYLLKLFFLLSYFSLSSSLFFPLSISLSSCLSISPPISFSLPISFSNYYLSFPSSLLFSPFLSFFFFLFSFSFSRCPLSPFPSALPFTPPSIQPIDPLRQGTIYRIAQLRYTQIVYCTLWEECKQTQCHHRS